MVPVLDKSWVDGANKFATDLWIWHLYNKWIGMILNRNLERVKIKRKDNILDWPKTYLSFKRIFDRNSISFLFFPVKNVTAEKLATRDDHGARILSTQTMLLICHHQRQELWLKPINWKGHSDDSDEADNWVSLLSARGEVQSRYPSTSPVRWYCYPDINSNYILASPSSFSWSSLSNSSSSSSRSSSSRAGLCLNQLSQSRGRVQSL